MRSIIKKNNLKVDLNGYNGNVGESKSNFKLSFKRGNSVKEFLFRLGCNSYKILVNGKVDAKHIEPNELNWKTEKSQLTVNLID